MALRGHPLTAKMYLVFDDTNNRRSGRSKRTLAAHGGELMLLRKMDLQTLTTRNSKGLGQHAD